MDYQHPKTLMLPWMTHHKEDGKISMDKRCQSILELWLLESDKVRI
jgi:hypothetical protein